MIVRTTTMAAAICLGMALTAPAQAQDSNGEGASTSAQNAGADAPTSAEPPAPPPPPAKEPEVSVTGAWTQFLGSAVEGAGGSTLRYGGRFDLYAAIPSASMGMGDAFTINIHPEFIYGSSTNSIGGTTLLPTNTALMFPSNQDEDFDLSVNVTFKTGGKSTLTVGKINLLDLVPKTPILGGGGIEGYQNITLAAPPSGLVPPSLFGALLSIPTDKAIFGLWVYDPVSATNRTGFENPFEHGVAFLASATVPVTIGGKLGFQNIKVSTNTRRGFDLRDLPELILPPGTTVISGKTGAWNVTYSFQQFLGMSSKVRGNGWGIYGQISKSDGNPTPLDWSGFIGIGGNISDARPADKFGVAYFHQSFSDTLENILSPLIFLNDEQGVEAFYTAQVGKVLRLTFDAQVVEPSLRSRPTAVIVGLRARAGF